jgi:hypothetical protein
MKIFFIFSFLSSFFFSCKPPLPVYFDKPIGTKVQGFDTLIAGNYIPLDDVIEKGTKEFSDKYVVKYDKIISKDTNFSVETNGKEINYDELKNIIGTKKDSNKIEINEKNCDSIFNSFCSFNKLISTQLGASLDKKGSNPKAGMIKISFDRIFFISVDSAGKNSRDTLVSLGQKIILTKYSSNYFLNFKTPFGWEILQMDIWEEKFLSCRPFYFTNYDDCAKNISELIASTRNIYPDLLPIRNPERKVIGFTAKLNSKLLIDKFSQSQEVVLLLKIQ